MSHARRTRCERSSVECPWNEDNRLDLVDRLADEPRTTENAERRSRARSVPTWSAGVAATMINNKQNFFTIVHGTHPL